jgi:3-methyl-2-oxobutanoate hydroxymethyltransferase
MIKHMVDVGVPVCGHLGLTPQSTQKFGGYGLRAKEDAEAAKLISDAKALEAAGCFAIVLEKVPAALAKRVSEEVSCPTIGIGAGNGCDGQVLVYADMLGMSHGFKPKFLRRYADLETVITDAVGNYCRDVKSGAFPSAEESY